MAEFSHSEVAAIYLRQARQHYEAGNHEHAQAAAAISQAASLSALAAVHAPNA